MKKAAYKTIEQYIKRHPRNVQKMLRLIRQTIKKAAPEAKEKISYQIPTFTLHGNLVHFGAFADHVSFFPAGSSAIRAFRKELSKYLTSKGTIRIPFDKPLPLNLIRKIVRFRVKQNIGWKKK